MAHLVKRQMDAIVLQLERLDIPVYRNRSTPVPSAPAIVIKMGAEKDSGQAGLSYEMRQLDFTVDLYVMADLDADLDGLLLDLRASVESVLIAFPESDIQYLEFGGQQSPTFNNDADQPVAAMRLDYSAFYIKRV